MCIGYGGKMPYIDMQWTWCQDWCVIVIFVDVSITCTHAVWDTNRMLSMVVSELYTESGTRLCLWRYCPHPV